MGDFHHGFTVGHRHGEGLFAQNMLAVLSRQFKHGTVLIVGYGQNHRVDIRAFHHFLSRFENAKAAAVFIAQLFRQPVDPVGQTAANDSFALDAGRKVGAGNVAAADNAVTNVAHTKVPP